MCGVRFPFNPHTQATTTTTTTPPDDDAAAAPSLPIPTVNTAHCVDTMLHVSKAQPVTTTDTQRRSTARVL